MTFYIVSLALSDLILLAGLVLAWFLSGWISEHPPRSRPSVSWLMEDYRRDWMRTFVTREPRIFDATLIDSLRQGTAFFASACMIAIGGGVAVIGNAAAVQRLADDLPLSGGPEVALKMLPVIGFLANALLKFVWAHRLFGYCSILMAAVPNDPQDPLAFHRASQAAEINITAAQKLQPRAARSTSPWPPWAGCLAPGVCSRARCWRPGCSSGASSPAIHAR
jgi:uncharacterized membrane protein